MKGSLNALLCSYIKNIYISMLLYLIRMVYGFTVYGPVVTTSVYSLILGIEEV